MFIKRLNGNRTIELVITNDITKEKGEDELID